MKKNSYFNLTQGVYHLFLGLWFGAMVMLAVSAMITFKTVRAYQPTLGLAPYNDPSLAGDAVSILGGAITGRVLVALGLMQTICALMVVSCVVLQATYFKDRFLQNWSNWIRSVLILLPVLILFLDMLVISPKMWSMRGEMFDPTRDLAQRQTVRDKFMLLHKLDERLVGSATLLLAGAILLSPFALKSIVDEEKRDE